MSDLDALIRACKDEPDDDAPRLILADWLEEHGETDRAAFIRRQIAEPGISEELCPINPVWLGEWERWRQEWLLDPKNPIKSPSHAVKSRRGFFGIADVYRELYDRLDEILRPPFDWTWIDSIEFGSWHDGDWTPLFQSSRLVELNALAFNDDMYSSNLIGPLVASSYLRNLRSLRLYEVVVDDDGMTRLSQKSALMGVQDLMIAGAVFSLPGLVEFCESEVWDRLHSLNLRENLLTDLGLSEIAGGRCRPHLEVVDVLCGRYTDAGLQALSQSDRFPSLRELTIGYRSRADELPERFGTAGIQALLDSPHFRLEKLNVWVLSPEPVPTELLQLEEVCSNRLSVRHHLIPQLSQTTLDEIAAGHGN